MFFSLKIFLKGKKKNGIIKGAKLYLGVTVLKEEFAPEALGYDFERLVLYITSLDLGTCWLGGTFKREAFTSVMEIKEGEVFPILSPLGYPAQKRSFTENIMRKSIKADGRFPWRELFFKENFKEILLEEEAGELAFPLEMVRLASSAVNKQPWRLVVTKDVVHFFEKHSMPKEGSSMDMQRINVGIAICHFHMAAIEKKIPGHFERKIPKFEILEDATYITSWIRE